MAQRKEMGNRFKIQNGLEDKKDGRLAGKAKDKSRATALPSLVHSALSRKIRIAADNPVRKLSDTIPDNRNGFRLCRVHPCTYR